MDIYVFRENRAAARQKEICFRFLFAQGNDGDVYLLSRAQLTPGGIGSFGEELAVFLTDTGAELEELSKAIRSCNRENYVIVSVQDMMEVLTAIPPSVRPSGFLLEPPEEEQLQSLLREIYRDCVCCAEEGQSFTFRVKARQYILPCSRILFFESSNKKLMVYTESQSFAFYESMANVSQRLPECFLRIHKSILVNTDHIVTVDYGRMEAELTDGSRVPVSRSSKRTLQEQLGWKGAAP